MSNRLYYGDNLPVLREEIAAETVDLIYLDPPFNSNATYNLLFRAPTGQKSEAQIEAFEDSWHWSEAAARAFDEVLRSRYSDAATMLHAMRGFLGENDLMAYLAMMAVRLLELHRVLKPTGSLYLHCDPTAGHYIKVLLDAVFGKENYRNEIVWLRTYAHNMKARTWHKQNDTIFFYTKSSRFLFHTEYGAYGAAQMQRFHADPDGRLYKAENLTFSTSNPSRRFAWRGAMPGKGRSWGADEATLETWLREGRILLKKDGSPRLDGLKVYLEETKGKPQGTNWTDIPRIGNTSAERLGYPTQKPLALLERILGASSAEGDLVLDPFCGCGTAVHAAEKLGRRWVGIDITHLAISLIERRLRDAFPGIGFEVHGTPRDLAGARDLAARDKYQFQWWAVSLVDAVPQGGKKKGADRGIDGVRLVRTGPKEGAVERVIVSVKGGEHVTSAMVRDLKGTMEREAAAAGLFLTLAEPTREMRREAAAAGVFETAFGSHPRIQIFTIAELLAGMRPQLPAHGRGEGFRQAPREGGRNQPKLDL